MADEQRDVIEVLEHDHREVEQMFAEIESLRASSTDEAKSRRKELTEQVTIELVRHSVAEEVLVYPQVEKKISAEEAEHARKEHAEAEETMHRLERLDADDPGFDDALAELMGEIRHHIADEEGKMFAHMREVIGDDDLRKLGARVEAFKKVAPTRPHPNVPNEALPRLAAGPVASLFDRLRDVASGRGDMSAKAVAAGVTGAAAVAAGVAVVAKGGSGTSDGEKAEAQPVVEADVRTPPPAEDSATLRDAPTGIERDVSPPQ